jgi:hypothetical protein
VPLNHPARAIDAVIEKLDLEPFYQVVRSHHGGSGAWATDPKL